MFWMRAQARRKVQDTKKQILNLVVLKWNITNNADFSESWKISFVFFKDILCGLEPILVVQNYFKIIFNYQE